MRTVKVFVEPNAEEIATGAPRHNPEDLPGPYLLAARRAIRDIPEISGVCGSGADISFVIKRSDGRELRQAATPFNADAWMRESDFTDRGDRASLWPGFEATLILPDESRAIRKIVRPTADDVDKGVSCSSEWCPYAEAERRVLEDLANPLGISVCEVHVRPHDTATTQWILWKDDVSLLTIQRIPERVSRRAQAFDEDPYCERRSVVPWPGFYITIELPV